MRTRKRLILRFRILLGLFIAGLVLSGLTAFPLRTELELLARLLGIAPDADYRTLTGLSQWIAYVRQGLRESGDQFPFLAYGTDWLAFGHLVIALFFVGPFLRPAEERWTLIAGVIACAGVVPLALICGPLRGIPFYWRLIDCSFGLLGAVPLLWCLRLQTRLRASAKSGFEPPGPGC